MTFCLFGLWFNDPVNSFGRVETSGSILAFFLGQAFLTVHRLVLILFRTFWPILRNYLRRNDVSNVLCKRVAARQEPADLYLQLIACFSRTFVHT